MRTPEIRHRVKTVMLYLKISIVRSGVFWLKRSEAAATARLARRCFCGCTVCFVSGFVFCVFLC